ncbi:MAG: porin [Labilithrix sp.]|nr:porin [Labilithrix sp.]MCW5813683.1 porin [Labilithrix sp.]
MKVAFSLGASVCFILLGTSGARAQEEPSERALEISPVGYVEAHYAYNFNRPSNGITNFRGFDNRHNTFTLANAAAGANADYGPVTARLIVQVGSTPSTYYLSEPNLAGTGGTNASNAELWKYLQEANVAYKAPLGRGLLLQLGLVPSPIGLESFAIKDNWSYSRSNLFFGFPFYHTGFRATYEWTKGLTTTVAVFNGWNSVVDDNDEKSVQADVTYESERAFLKAVYFGGVERPAGRRLLEGPAWRHTFDVVAQVRATTWLSFASEAVHGWEANRLGIASWTATAIYARVKPLDRVYVALRGDRFHERLAHDGSRASTPIFWNGVGWVSSGTATLDVRPHDHLSVRLEVRHDAASAPLFFRRDVRGDGSPASPYLPNATSQNTLLLGATAWL